MNESIKNSRNFPIVSVLMPAYNALPLIRASIESLLSQTYKNWECIIVDDGSTDGTSAYLNSLTDERFVVHHFKENQGRPKARQKTLELATGKYICMLDAGDLYHPRKLQLQVDMLETTLDIDLVATKMGSFGTATDIVRVRGGAHAGFITFNGHNVPCHATCMLRADLAKPLKYNPALKVGQDVDLLEKYLQDRQYSVINTVLYYYLEFDSVTRRKIRKTYRLYVTKYRKQRKFSRMFVYGLKYVYSLIVFPLMPMKQILSKRGVSPSKEELSDFNQYCIPLVNNVL